MIKAYDQTYNNSNDIQKPDLCKNKLKTKHKKTESTTKITDLQDVGIRQTH